VKLAGIFARHWDAFAGAKPYLLNAAHFRAAEAVRACRTAALGAEVYQCACCKRKRLRYHSCNHRACTQCGKHKQHEWSQAQEAKLLDTDYYLLTFTLPAELRVTCYKQQQWFYGIMFDAVSDTLKALDLKRKRVLPDGVFNPDTLGFTAVLHTWTREMQYHPHIHVVMPGLSLANGGQRIHRPAVADYLMPHRAIAKRFQILLRRKLAAHDAETNRADLAAIPQAGWNKRWVVDVEAVGNGRSALRYLARYVHRSAVSDQRLLGATPDGRIKLNCQNSRTKRWQVIMLDPHEFLRRWCLHVLPKGFTRVRHYGYLSAAAVEKRGKIRDILQMPESMPKPQPKPAARPECPCCTRPMELLGSVTRHGQWRPAPSALFDLGLAMLQARGPAVRQPIPDTGWKPP
jgi:hypothetical protein